MSGLEQVGPVEPTPRPSEPAWKWKGGGWKAEIGGLECYLFNGFGSDPDYHAAVQLPSGAHLTGDLFKGVEEAAEDARLLSRLARLYQVGAHLRQPLDRDPIVGPSPPSPDGFHPRLLPRIVGACELLHKGGGDPAIGLHVAQLTHALESVQMGAPDLAMLVAHLVHQARVSGYQERRREEAAERAAQPAEHPVRARAELVTAELDFVRQRIRAAHALDDRVDRLLKAPEKLTEATVRHLRGGSDAIATALAELTVAEDVLEWVVGQRRRPPSDVVIPKLEGV